MTFTGIASLFSHGLTVEKSICEVETEASTDHTNIKVTEWLHHGQEKSKLRCTTKVGSYDIMTKIGTDVNVVAKATFFFFFRKDACSVYVAQNGSPKFNAYTGLYQQTLLTWMLATGLLM